MVFGRHRSTSTSRCPAQHEIVRRALGGEAVIVEKPLTAAAVHGDPQYRAGRFAGDLADPPGGGGRNRDGRAVSVVVIGAAFHLFAGGTCMVWGFDLEFQRPAPWRSRLSPAFDTPDGLALGD